VLRRLLLRQLQLPHPRRLRQGTVPSRLPALPCARSRPAEPAARSGSGLQSISSSPIRLLWTHAFWVVCFPQILNINWFQKEANANDEVISLPFLYLAAKLVKQI
jgi:hypothetical protein